MRLQISILIFFLIFAAQYSMGQAFYKNLFYYEAFGHTRSSLSFNYERTVYVVSKKFHLNARTGIAFAKYYDNNDNVTDRANTIPFVALLEYGNKSHFVNIGVGYSVSFIKKINSESDIPRFDSAYSISIGYKFIHPQGIFMQFYPVILKPKISESEISAGLAFGFSW